ncbi:MAG: hypothetical protein AAFU79_18275 [Myxococcota bacterium]
MSSLPLVAVGLLAAAAGCRGEPKSTRWDEKAAEVKSGAPKVDKSTVAAGSTLNAFFPKEEGGVTRTFTQEKTGFAEAKLVVDGKTVKVSISDVRMHPKAAGKFESAPAKVDGHPLVTVGSKQSALLVAGRWQVKVSSSELDPPARAQLLERFDLAGLSAH